MTGRPSAYSAGLADIVLALLAEGLSLSEICRRDDMPARSTVHQWIADNVDGFTDKYARAREAQADRFADEIVEIADDSTNDWVERKRGKDTVTDLDYDHVQRSKLRVDARKWLMARMAPKKYGDRVAAEITGKDGKDLLPAETDPSRIALALLSVLQAAKSAPTAKE